MLEELDGRPPLPFIEARTEPDPPSGSSSLVVRTAAEHWGPDRQTVGERRFPLVEPPLRTDDGASILAQVAADGGGAPRPLLLRRVQEGDGERTWVEGCSPDLAMIRDVAERRATGRPARTRLVLLSLRGLPPHALVARAGDHGDASEWLWVGRRWLAADDPEAWASGARLAEAVRRLRGTPWLRDLDSGPEQRRQHLSGTGVAEVEVRFGRGAVLDRFAERPLPHDEAALLVHCCQPWAEVRLDDFGPVLGDAVRQLVDAFVAASVVDDDGGPGFGDETWDGDHYPDRWPELTAEQEREQEDGYVLEVDPHSFEPEPEYPDWPGLLDALAHAEHALPAEDLAEGLELAEEHLRLRGWDAPA